MRNFSPSATRYGVVGVGHGDCGRGSLSHCLGGSGQSNVTFRLRRRRSFPFWGALLLLSPVSPSLTAPSLPIPSCPPVAPRPPSRPPLVFSTRTHPSVMRCAGCSLCRLCARARPSVLSGGSWAGTALLLRACGPRRGRWTLAVCAILSAERRKRSFLVSSLSSSGAGVSSARHRRLTLHGLRGFWLSLRGTRRLEGSRRRSIRERRPPPESPYRRTCAGVRCVLRRRSTRSHGWWRVANVECATVRRRKGRFMSSKGSKGGGARQRSVHHAQSLPLLGDAQKHRHCANVPKC